MNKCKHYPDCRCYLEHVEPALKVASESEAEFYRVIMREICNFCENSTTGTLSFELLKPLLLKQIEILPTNLQILFSDLAPTRIGINYGWRFSIQSDIERIKLLLKNYLLINKTESKNINPLKCIKPELHHHLTDVEKKIKGRIEKWKQQSDIIECAGFCEALYDKKWFTGIPLKTKTVNNSIVRSFALGRYGVNIDVQLKSAKKNDRTVHKIRFMKSSIW